MAIKMAKTATMTASGGSSNSGMPTFARGWIDRVKGFYTDVRMEMKKVTTPSLKEVQSTTAVVIIAVFLFGVYFWLIDNAIGKTIDQFLRYLSTHR